MPDFVPNDQPIVYTRRYAQDFWKVPFAGMTIAEIPTIGAGIPFA